MNPLDTYPQARKVAYLIQWIVNLTLGVIAVVLTSMGESPLWFVITTGAFNFVWSYTGLTAQTNTPPPAERGDHLPHYSDDDADFTDAEDYTEGSVPDAPIEGDPR